MDAGSRWLRSAATRIRSWTRWKLRVTSRVTSDIRGLPLSANFAGTAAAAGACSCRLFLFRFFRCGRARALLLLSFLQALLEDLHEIDNLARRLRLCSRSLRRNTFDLGLNHFEDFLVVVVLVLLRIERVGHRIDEHVRQI